MTKRQDLFLCHSNRAIYLFALAGQCLFCVLLLAWPTVIIQSVVYACFKGQLSERESVNWLGGEKLAPWQLALYLKLPRVLLLDQNPQCRWYAPRIARRCGHSAESALIYMLHDDDVWVRLDAAAALISIDAAGKAQAVPALVDALSDESMEAPWLAAGLLGEMGRKAEAAIPALVDVLDRGGSLSECAALALGKMGEGVVPMIVSELSRRPPFPRVLG